ncbi:uncharacterized protein [Physcomitrium patens]|uniref:Uncharacterized protein n=1 Tax=Physcomitrium patens TaxID=3218 RepID=A9TS63_PHYPA|nr:uncharacterized protein LOC112296131 [Physcomitrium patens]XP_024404105.1 uncharacterized protein LOC112296131 [Physcomitrium patens]XP_024404107.1 uncharacterized protein LOC112296131 [Physcomitrium patens]XP_024404108.1 uncharacterized protein LOC112296131 [Physcomitrium patens]XP_024404109.1 uncharacterized protein LOC112296131 [Physcomitrium patens]XP_024404110.1 uncharacterized protein LOC112296131 [Physcomitrium patens]XP_024404111.1 uncharacterized protein LOC112296131 [Physcomitriu|eukprot:XP_024404104.1 uncharacterized protein LOC112296131 [Physcomitrella patens]
MGPFGASYYSMDFIVPFNPKLPPSDDGVPPTVASLADAWKGLGLTYFLLKGLQRSSETFKLIGDTIERHSKNDVQAMGRNGTSGIDQGACRSLTTTNAASARSLKNQNMTGYSSLKMRRNAGPISSHAKACKNNMLEICRGEQKDSLFADSLRDFSERPLDQSATRSGAESRLLTEKSLREFGLGIEGVMTTITGLTKQAYHKDEVKEIITVVKTADRVVEGVKAAKGVIQTFSSPFSDTLFGLGAGGNGVILGVNTVKIVLKGVKISKGLITVTKLCKNKKSGAIGAGAKKAIKSNQNTLGKRFRVIMKGLKASEGAANVVSMTKEVGKTLGPMFDKGYAEFLSWSVIMKGFKFTKSAIRVLEPVGSLQLGVIRELGKCILEMKGAVEGIGVVVKAIVLSQELYMVLLKGFEFAKGSMAVLNESYRRSFLNKLLPEILTAESNCVSEGHYSARTRVSFKGMCNNQLLPMPSISWSLSEVERNSCSSGWDFFGCSYSPKSIVLHMLPELLRDGEDIKPPFSFLTLSSSFQS